MIESLPANHTPGEEWTSAYTRALGFLNFLGFKPRNATLPPSAPSYTFSTWPKMTPGLPIWLFPVGSKPTPGEGHNTGADADTPAAS